MEAPKLHDYQVTQIAAASFHKRETVRRYLSDPSAVRPSTRAGIERALRELGLLTFDKSVK